MSEQRATAQLGSTGNVIVQIVGDGNSVVVGRRQLKLTRYEGLRRQTSEIERLSPYSRSTMVVGRDDDLVDLDIFLADSRQILTRVISGRGGSGKTRLALELCERYAERGWNTGFVTRKELARFTAEQNAGDWGWQHPTLIVVDYAATQIEALGTWFDELTANALTVSHRLRFLLLEREAKVDGGWFQSLFRAGGWTTAGRFGLLDPPEPVELLPIRKLSDRLALLREVLAREAHGLHLPSGNAEFNQKLDELTWGGEPLFLMMAAHTMAKYDCEHALTLKREDLAIQLAANEAERLTKLASVSKLDLILVRHLAACVTLAQGLSREAFFEFVEKEKLAIGRPSGGDAAVLFDVLTEALPQNSGIAPVLPDMIGEAFICRTLATGGTAAVLRCFQAFGFVVFESVIRCAQDFCGQPKSATSSVPLAWLNGLFAALSNDEAALLALDALLPEDSVVLQNFSLQIAEHLTELVQTRVDSPLAYRALTVGKLALRKAKAGQYKLALALAQEATEHCRSIATQQPGIPYPNLATTLNTLANILVQLKRYVDAHDVAKEAVEIFRELAEYESDIFLQDFAASLNTFANCLSGLDKFQEALYPAKEALEIYRVLASKNRNVYLGSLARSLTGLANRLGDVHQYKEALAASQESTDIYRTIAVEQPDVFRAEFAVSLNNLAICLNDIEEIELGWAAANESVDILENLVAQGSEVSRSYLTSALRTRSKSYSNFSQRQLAMRAAHLAGEMDRLKDEIAAGERFWLAAGEAIEHYQLLASQRPDVFQHALAKTLMLIALRHIHEKSPLEAARISHEALKTLMLIFLAEKSTHEHLMAAIRRDHVQFCLAAGVLPDEEFL